MTTRDEFISGLSDKIGVTDFVKSVVSGWEKKKKKTQEYQDEPQPPKYAEGTAMLLAVDKKTGTIAQEIRDSGVTINASTHDLEDHRFVLRKNVWYDVGPHNNEQTYSSAGTRAPTYVQNKYK